MEATLRLFAVMGTTGMVFVVLEATGKLFVVKEATGTVFAVMGATGMVFAVMEAYWDGICCDGDYWDVGFCTGTRFIIIPVIRYQYQNRYGHSYSFDIHFDMFLTRYTRKLQEIYVFCSKLC